LIRRRLLGVFVFLAALGAWEVWARRQESFLVPPASTVLERAWEVWPTNEFLSMVAPSLERLAVGYVLGVTVGICLGVVLGASPSVRRALEPLTEFLRAVPPIALVPILIVILGLDDGMRIAVIAWAVCFPVLVNTIEGVRAVSPEARDTAAMLHVGPVEQFYRLYLPAALPSIVAGMRIAVSVGLVMVVISELVGSQDGLGYYINTQQSLFAVPEMYAGLLFLGLLGYVLNQLFLVAERRVLAWHWNAR
jgi:ABC-type nitrate/sulfonate/bicarbonate transport system permease component